MTEKLPPFMNSTGLPEKILNKIIEAAVPPVYSHDFQKDVLGFGSGSARAFISILKKLGFIDQSGTPTASYNRFRTESGRSLAMLEGLKLAYPSFYRRREYAHQLPDNELKDLIIDLTGRESGDQAVRAILGTFKALKQFVIDDVGSASAEALVVEEDSDETSEKLDPKVLDTLIPTNGRRLALSYTINLNLPASKDPEIFDAIFESLKRTLLEG